MSRQDCHHFLVELDNAGAVGLFKCIRCGARVAGTAKDVAKYRIISGWVLVPAKVLSFFVVVGSFLFFVSHVSQGKGLVLLVPLALIWVILIWQIMVARRRKRSWFGWLMTVLYAITLIVAFIIYATR